MVDPIDATQALAWRAARRSGTTRRDTEVTALRRAATYEPLAEVVEARALWADPFETVEEWVAAGVRAARRLECRAWEIADWAFLGPERLGNAAFQFLGDGDRNPDEDAGAVFPLSGKTLKNYSAVAARFPPSIAFAFPDIAPRFTIFQDLTPRDLDDAFVLGVLAAAQGSFDDRRAWDGAAETARAPKRPSVWTRRDVRDAVRIYRHRLAPPAPDAGPPPPMPPEWTPADDPSLAPPAPNANPFGPPITVAIGRPIAVDDRFAAPLSFNGAGPLVVRSVAPVDASGDWSIVVDVDVDTVRTAVQEAVADVLTTGLIGPDFVDDLVAKIVAAITRGETP